MRQYTAHRVAKKKYDDAHAMHHKMKDLPGAPELHQDVMVTPQTARQCAAAAPAHGFTTKDLNDALELYRSIVAASPNAQVAEYARVQIRNIVKAVVPRQAILDAQVMLALTVLEDESVELRQQRDEVDNKWKTVEIRRREREIDRRVQETLRRS